VLEPDYPIETERLLLRPFEPGDLEPLHAIHSRADVARWLYLEPRDEGEVREMLDRKMGDRAIAEEGDRLSLAGVLREGGELVGDFSLRWRSKEHRQGEIGFVVHPEHQGRGYATEASAVLLRLGFEGLGLHRVVGALEPRNTASARVLERLGMRHEGRLVENEWVKGEWQSEDVYAILDREWREATR
jgi:RimJ/RimL family protein N-acetyltransferase